MSNPDFVPEFGPNGAVMNAPTMTPGMRAKIEEIGKIPPRETLLRHAWFILVCGLLPVLLLNQGQPLLEFLKASPWWAGAFAGAVAVATAVALRRTVRFNLKRWELRKSQRSNRSLNMPEWGRWLFAATDSIAVSAYSVALAWFIADINRDYPTVWLLTGFFAGNVAAIGLGIRWYATRRGWDWRIKTA